MYPSVSSLGHDALTRHVLLEFQRQGLTDLRADHVSGFVRPDAIGGFIPDATAYHNGVPCIAECESSEGLRQSHTADQWRAFHAHVSRIGGWFITVVAKADEVAARALLAQTVGSAQNVLLWTF